MNIKQITIVVIVVLALILIAQNTQVVTIDIFFWEISMSQVLLMPLLLLLGVIIGYLAHWQIKRGSRSREPVDRNRSDRQSV